MNYGLLEDVAFKRVCFLFGLEDSDVQVVFRSIFRSLYLFPIRLVEKFIIFSISPYIAVDC